jgi:pyruvate dehydrogenase E1 component alpha subunit
MADLAFGYGIPAAVVDGQDVIAVYEAVQEAVSRGRAGEGPSFIEFKTCRFRAHSENHRDIVQNGIRPETEINKWKERDPVGLFRKTLIDEGILNQELIERIYAEAEQELEDAERFALEDPYPDASILETALFAD